MHTHNNDTQTKSDMLTKLLNNYDIDFEGDVTSLKKHQLEKILDRQGLLPNKPTKPKEKCYFCEEDSKYILEQHHVVPKRYNGSNDDKNLVTLCRRCHRKLEEMYSDDVLAKIARNINSDPKTTEEKKSFIEAL